MAIANSDDIKDLVWKMIQEMDLDSLDFRVEEKEHDQIEVFTKHKVDGYEAELSLSDESSGTKKLFGLLPFFNDELVIYAAENQDNWMNDSLYQMNTNEKVKKAVVTFLDELGTGIRDIRVIIDQKELETSQLPPFLSDEFKTMLLQEKVDAISAKVIYDEFETDLMLKESAGIRKLFGMLCPLLDIMMNGKVLICDEIESSLYESLVFELIKLFVNVKTEKFAQMIFTTHETGLLNLDLFRRDQIWFTEMKGADRSTNLFSLAEIKNVRKEDNFSKGYITGKYGAIPMLNLDFANVVVHKKEYPAPLLQGSFS